MRRIGEKKEVPKNKDQLIDYLLDRLGTVEVNVFQIESDLNFRMQLTILRMFLKKKGRKMKN
jgi:hypothetical protein